LFGTFKTRKLTKNIISKQWTEIPTIMETEIYQLLKERKSNELLSMIRKRPELIFFKDQKGVSLLMLSLYFGNPDISDYILSQRDVADLFEAASCGRVDAVKPLIDHNRKSIDQFSVDGFSALGFAAYFSKPDVARILLENGADPNTPSNNSFMVTPLHSAVAAKNLAITSMLLDHGADANARQQKNITPLHSAAHNGSVDIVKLLLHHGADPNAVTDDGKSPYDFAVESGVEEIINLLSEYLSKRS
jgi:uncharacterized protein